MHLAQVIITGNILLREHAKINPGEDKASMKKPG